MLEELQNLFIKGVFVLLASPLWFPLMRAVWQEFNEAMAEEGGLFGRPPTGRELEEIRRARRLRPEPLVHEPFSPREAGRRPATPPRPSAPRASERAPRRAGF